MNVPNWQHHSKKEQKQTLKPQALRARRSALQDLKRKIKYTKFSHDTIRIT